jgi:hypothetical protein
MIYMQTSDNDVQKQYKKRMSAGFEVVGTFNGCVEDDMYRTDYLHRWYNDYLSSIRPKLQTDDYNVFSSMQIKLIEGEIDETSPRKAFDKNNGFLRSFNNSSILDVDLQTATIYQRSQNLDELPIGERTIVNQQRGQQFICDMVAAKLRSYGEIDRSVSNNKVPKPSDKAGKILQLIIKKQHGKEGFKLLLQEIVNEFMPGNEINIENIFQSIKQDQITDMYFESDSAGGKNLVIQTNDKEFTFDKDGVLKTTCNIHRSIFGTMRRTNLKHVTTQVLSNAVPTQPPTQVTTPMSSQGSTAIQQVPSKEIELLCLFKRAEFKQNLVRKV